MVPSTSGGAATSNGGAGSNGGNAFATGGTPSDGGAAFAIGRPMLFATGGGGGGINAVGGPLGVEAFTR